MLKSRHVAITGLPGSGKSSICQLFKELGAEVIDSDAIAHRLLTPTGTVGNQLLQLLGDDCRLGNAFDRSKIAEKVFHTPSLLKKLEELLHPSIRDHIHRYMSTCRAPVCLVEVPLLYEVGWEGDYDLVIAVSAPKEECHNWFVKKRGRQFPDDFEERIARHLPQIEKCRRADILIVNDGTLEALKPKVSEIYATLVE